MQLLKIDHRRHHPGERMTTSDLHEAQQPHWLHSVAGENADATGKKPGDEIPLRWCRCSTVASDWKPQMENSSRAATERDRRPARTARKS
jgi:hypothetical protein